MKSAGSLADLGDDELVDDAHSNPQKFSERMLPFH
jgi:hypothetical protein